MVAGIGAALAVYDAGIARLVLGEAEVFKLFHHLTAGDILIQAAVGVGAGVLGILFRQRGKALFGLRAGLILCKDLLGTRPGSLLGLVAVGPVLAGTFTVG